MTPDEKLDKLEHEWGGPGGHAQLWKIGEEDEDWLLTIAESPQKSWYLRVVPKFLGHPTVIITAKPITLRQVRQLERAYVASRARA